MALADTLREGDFYLRVEFVPPCVLNKEVQHQLLQELRGQKVDFNSVEFGQAELVLSQKDPNDRACRVITAASTSLDIQWAFPNVSIEVVKKEADAIFEAAKKILNIQIIAKLLSRVQCAAAAYGVDARVFLGETVLGGLAEKLVPFRRPAHCVGLRLFFPAVGNPPQTEQYPMEVKIESLMEDTSQLFIEVLRTAVKPEQVTDRTRLGDHLEATKSFLVDHALGFLEEAKKRGNT